MFEILPEGSGEVGKWPKTPQRWFFFLDRHRLLYIIINTLKTTFINMEPSLPIYLCYNIKNFIYVRENIDYVCFVPRLYQLGPKIVCAAVPVRSQKWRIIYWPFADIASWLTGSHLHLSYGAHATVGRTAKAFREIHRLWWTKMLIEGKWCLPPACLQHRDVCINAFDHCPACDAHRVEQVLTSALSVVAQRRHCFLVLLLSSGHLCCGNADAVRGWGRAIIHFPSDWSQCL